MNVIIDKTSKTIKIEKPIMSDELFEILKKMYFSDDSLLSIPFPLRIEKKDELKIYFITNGWTFDGLSSYENVLDNMLMDKPEPPIVPSQTRRYKDKHFGKFAKLEDILASVPKEINNKSAHLWAKDGDLVLKIGGVWPNPDLDQEMSTFKREYSEFEKCYKQYEKIMLLPN